ncbi:hypothetical protein BH10BAC1_BH10BAC1_17610 [soil metagenome]
MKKIFPLFFIICVSCQNNSNPENTCSFHQIDSSTNTTILTDSSSIQKDTIPLKNQKDKNGRKQGLWDYYDRGIVKGFQTYKNDILNGPFKYWINNEEQMTVGNYMNGKREGYIKGYYLYSKRELSIVTFYKNDTQLWYGFPHAEEYYFPVKQFTINSDSVYIKCPYENDVIWYEGLVVKKKPVGIHKMYFPNGKLKFEVNWALKTVREFDSTGTFKSEKKKEGMSGW